MQIEWEKMIECEADKPGGLWNYVIIFKGLWNYVIIFEYKELLPLYLLIFKKWNLKKKKVLKYTE